MLLNEILKLETLDQAAAAGVWLYAAGGSCHHKARIKARFGEFDQRMPELKAKYCLCVIDASYAEKLNNGKLNVDAEIRSLRASIEKLEYYHEELSELEYLYKSHDLAVLKMPMNHISEKTQIYFLAMLTLSALCTIRMSEDAVNTIHAH